jgi:hypothetical protein
MDVLPVKDYFRYQELSGTVNGWISILRNVRKKKSPFESV